MLAYDKYRDYHTDSPFPVFIIKFPGQDTWINKDIDTFRADEYGAFVVTESDAEVFYDKSWLNKVDAIINITRTFMVCCLLGGASYYFNRDS